MHYKYLCACAASKKVTYLSNGVVDVSVNDIWNGLYVATI